MRWLFKTVIVNVTVLNCFRLFLNFLKLFRVDHFAARSIIVVHLVIPCYLINSSSFHVLSYKSKILDKLAVTMKKILCKIILNEISKRKCRDLILESKTNMQLVFRISSESWELIGFDRRISIILFRSTYDGQL